MCCILANKEVWDGNSNLKKKSFFPRFRFSPSLHVVHLTNPIHLLVNSTQCYSFKASYGITLLHNCRLLNDSSSLKFRRRSIGNKRFDVLF